MKREYIRISETTERFKYRWLRKLLWHLPNTSGKRLLCQGSPTLDDFDGTLGAVTYQKDPPQPFCKRCAFLKAGGGKKEW